MLLQAEQMYKIVKVVILSVTQHVKTVIFSQLEISHMSNGPTSKNQLRCKGPQASTGNPQKIRFQSVHGFSEMNISCHMKPRSSNQLLPLMTLNENDWVAKYLFLLL